MMVQAILVITESQTVTVMDASKFPAMGKTREDPGHVKIGIDGEGYPKNIERAAPLSDEAIALLTIEKHLKRNNAASADRRGFRF